MNIRHWIYVGVGGVVLIVLAVFFVGPWNIEAPADDADIASSTDEVTTEPPTPLPTGDETIVLAPGERKEVLGFSISPIEVMEDSRCPTDVVCVWAGSVRVRVLVASDGAVAREEFFVLNVAKTFGRHTVTLIEVAPAPVSSQNIAPGDYRFTFRIRAEN